VTFVDYAMVAKLSQEEMFMLKMKKG